MDASFTLRRARRLLLPLTAGLCALALVSGCSDTSSGSSASSAASRTGAGSADSGASRTGAEAAATPSGAITDLQNDYQTVIKNVLPSVVQIEASGGLGSGVVYDSKGHVVTNAHVVGSAKKFKVTVATGEKVVSASLVSAYPEQDLAVIKLDQVPDGLKPAKFGDSAKVEVGQIVLAMGSPLGLSSSVTQGIVSALGRTVSESRAGGGTGATIANMVQTSAAINPGNSGGALVNLDSEVIGIPTLAATDPDLGGSAAPGIGFAIPVSMVKTVADQIIKTGRVTDSGRAALDITGRTVVDDNYQPAGVALVSVARDGAADKAGLRPGDIVTKLDGRQVTTITSLQEALAADKPGEKVTVTYLRDGAERTAKVTLGEI
ncbi:trypsin-like peptidase domain-containing protein [Streptomyces sp. NPDC052095]|uniref:S1C family serine protease n=1 Tax=unclassified Streptomyces TaxID=2593676 RepID=UPI00344C3137